MSDAIWRASEELALAIERLRLARNRRERGAGHPGPRDARTLRDRLDAVVWELVPRQNDTAWGTDDA